VSATLKNRIISGSTASTTSRKGTTGTEERSLIRIRSKLSQDRVALLFVGFLFQNSCLFEVIGPGGCNLKAYDDTKALKKGHLVMGPYSVDGGEPEYYRAKILSISNPASCSSDLRRAVLFFIDYGNIAEVSVRNLRVFPPELLELPPIAMEGVLTGIGPSLIRDPKGEWIPEAKAWFTERTLDQLFTAKVSISPLTDDWGHSNKPGTIDSMLIRSTRSSIALRPWI